MKRRGKMKPSQIARLESLPGWSWEPENQQWDNAFDHLRRVVDRTGNPNILQSHRENNFRLGTWVNKQRGRFRRGTLEPERIRQLESLRGWSWEPGRDQNAESIEALRRYVARTGNIDVPAKHLEEGINLYSFIYNVRRRYKSGVVSRQLIQALEDIPGWTWTSNTRQLSRRKRKLSPTTSPTR